MSPGTARKLFTLLIPFRDVAGRANLLSALCAGAALAVLYLLAQKVAGNRAAAATATTLFALSPAWWSQATIAEVYAPEGAHLEVRLDLGTIAALHLEGVDAASVAMALVRAPKLHLKEAHVRVVRHSSLRRPGHGLLRGSLLHTAMGALIAGCAWYPANSKSSKR